MGDIADMVLDGTLCEQCGVLVDAEGPGHPRRCDGCEGADDEMDEDEDDLPEWLTGLIARVLQAIETNSPLEDPFNVFTRELTIEGMTEFEVQIYPYLVPTPRGPIPPCMHINVADIADLFTSTIGDIQWHPCSGSIAIDGIIDSHPVTVEIFDHAAQDDEGEDEDHVPDDHTNN